MNPCLERAASGDPHATSDLVDALRPRIAGMAAHYARRTGEDPDDLLQEAWVGLLESLPRLDMRIGTPEQYLIRQARWRLLDSVKRARVRRCVPLPEDAGPLPESVADSDPLGDACVAEFTRELKSSQRDVLACLMDGLTWREAGEALGCTSPNIAYHVRQIRRRYEDWSREPARLARHRSAAIGG